MTSARVRGHYLGFPILLFVLFVLLKNSFQTTTFVAQSYNEMSPRVNSFPRIISPFFEYVDLPDDLIPTYDQVKKLAQSYLNGDNLNWNDFRSYVNDADKDRIAPEDFNALPFKLSGDDAKVSILVDRVMQLLPPFVDKNAVNQSQLANDLTSVVRDFDALWDGQEPSARGVTEHSLSREYRALVGAPSAKPNYIRVDVATVSVSGHYKKEVKLGGIIPPKITKEGSVSIKVITLVVAVGFSA
ncbi:hypothetical protein AX16_005140 [Volvariella volvacea WC 439]|nr:hypothetical protein AX16_005140 [Volvariella volvacea WC 439]